MNGVKIKSGEDWVACDCASGREGPFCGVWAARVNVAAEVEKLSTMAPQV